MLESCVLFIESVWINNISVMGITIALDVFVQVHCTTLHIQFAYDVACQTRSAHP